MGWGATDGLCRLRAKQTLFFISITLAPFLFSTRLKLPVFPLLFPWGEHLVYFYPLLDDGSRTGAVCLTAEHGVYCILHLQCVLVFSLVFSAAS
jgi:hypothetical protein